MDVYESRERLFGSVKKIFVVLYVALALALTIINIVKGIPYYYLLSIGSLLIFPLVAGFHRLFRLERSNQMDFVIYFFTLIALLLGSVVDLYKVTWFYDKLMHCLSGTFVMILALPLYYKSRPGQSPDRHDCVQAVLFCIFTSLSIAGIWEMCEYVLTPLVGRDLQRVLSTGINDTMQDMLVCTLGTVIVIPSMVRYYTRGKVDFLISASHAFLVKNHIAAPGQEK